MTDRGETALRLSPECLEVGPSRMSWNGTTLSIEINERSVPHLDRLKGTVRLHPAAVTDVEMPLDASGCHLWRPFAPTAEIEVDFERPGWRWRGHGYFDANFGTRALEADFAAWTWARLPVGRGTVCLYDAQRREGANLATAVRFDSSGGAEPILPLARARLQRSRWGLARETRADVATVSEQVRPMLDAPFYCRSAIRSTILGETAVGVHETLDLDRFASPWLKPLLALRVPRRRRWPG